MTWVYPRRIHPPADRHDPPLAVGVFLVGAVAYFAAAGREPAGGGSSPP